MVSAVQNVEGNMPLTEEISLQEHTDLRYSDVIGSHISDFGAPQCEIFLETRLA